MNKQAFEVLRKSTLPYLADISIPSFMNHSGPSSDMYVRSTDGTPAPGRMPSESVRAFFRKNDPSHFALVEFTPSIGGAICIGADEGVYVELVDGHLSGLLRRGFLRARMFFEAKDGAVSLRLRELIEQPSRVNPESLTVEGTTEAPLKASLLDELGLVVARMVVQSKLPVGYLSEVLLTPKGPIWVDAKPYPWLIRYEALFAEPGEVLYHSVGWGSSSLNVSTHSASWNPEDVPKDIAHLALRLDGGPLGSHYVTYSLECGVLALYS